MATHESSDVLLKESRLWKWGTHPLDTTVESSFIAGDDEAPYMLTITTGGHKSHIPFSSLTHWRSFVSFILSIGQDGDEMRKRLEEGLNEEHGDLGL